MLWKIKTDDKSLKEYIKYRDMTFPVGVWTDVYNKFYNCTVNCHWHYDFEYASVISGIVDYYINDTCLKLTPGDCVFVNSNAMHTSIQPEGVTNSKMISLTFPASLLTASNSSTVFEKYFKPVFSKQMEGFKVAANSAYGEEIKALVLEIYSLDISEFGYELECMRLINRLWFVTLQYIAENEDTLMSNSSNTQNIKRSIAIMVYIHDHYKEKITIDDIAEYMSISRSECFRCFKRFMNKRPTEYINEYRLLKAVKLLNETDKSITEIFAECGYESASYFGRVFKKKYGMTPIQYRNSK